MEYSKPEMFVVGDAADVIQSSLEKNLVPVDSQTHIDLTGTPAYEADE